MMGAADVDGERRLGAVPRRADMRGAGAVIHRGRPCARNRLADGAAIEQIDGLPP